MIWLKDATCLGVLPWADALSAANALSAATAPVACGLTDGSAAGAWRLPNVKELQSLIDFGNVFPALPAAHPFSGGDPGRNWSSTTYADDHFAAWYVSLFDGYISLDRKVNTYFVWPVRGGQ